MAWLVWDSNGVNAVHQNKALEVFLFLLLPARSRDQRDEREVLQKVEVQFHQRRIDGVAGGVDLDRIAVWCGARQQFGGDYAVGAGAVFDNNRLAEAVGQARCQIARDEIGAAAR